MSTTQHPLYLKVKIKDSLGEMNEGFEQFQSYLNGLYGMNNPILRLSVYFAEKGIQTSTDKECILDPIWRHHPIVRRIERLFLVFASQHQSSFEFTAGNLGFILDPTDEELDGLVPDTIIDSNGKTWREWLPSTTKTFEWTEEYYNSSVPDDIVGDMTWGEYMPFLTVGNHTLYPIINYQNGINATRWPTHIDFWAVFESFGFAKIVLDYEYWEGINIMP